jgi:hypothetical protein
MMALLKRIHTMIFTGDNRIIGGALIACLVTLAHAGAAWGAEASPYRGAEEQTLAGLDEIRPYLTPPGGVVVSARDGVVFIGKESTAPVSPGISLKIVREKEPLIHPVTGEKIGAVTEPVGKVVVTGDDGKILTAVETGGGGKIRTGDRVESVSRKRKTVFVFEPGTDSAGMAAIRDAALGRVSSFAEASLVSPYAVERFLNDQNLAGTNALVSSPENLKKIQQGLAADFLIFAGAQDKDGAVLIDVELYDLSSGKQIASFKGLVKGSAVKGAGGKTPAETGAPKPEVKPLPAPLKIPLVSEKRELGPEPAQTANPPTQASPVTARTIGNFEGRITGISVFDLDGDGSPEIIIGFDQRLAVYKTADGGPLQLVWEKKLSKRDQIVSVHAGKFDGDGKPAIYVNNIVDGAARSMTLKERDGVFTVVSEGLRMFFYAGGDGRLYGQRQTADLGMEDKLVALEWSGDRLSQKPFMPLPEGARLSGVAIDDIDGDGVMDVIGVDKGKSLVYRSSVKGEWVKVDGEYGGSDIAIELPGQGEARVFHEIQPAPVPLKAGGKFRQLFVPHNHQAASFFSSLLLYLDSQLHLLSNEGGLGYAKTFSTPAGDGIIYAAAYFGPVDGGSAMLAARTETSVFGPGKSELIMFTVGAQ